ncbi:MAG: diguanylate cyclase [Candidatus Cloacimonetes bacterium]|nr:diguanylate cyclase [Candidatus Cloacimonadota bacterium]MCF7813299.1 diguanylate cyclase [Candidatus Cloacimonadota bacterium]MCF7867374.1 diguanylate cyclase [Candidatus Cloacimonadota bacterium]MCF7882808.1 diguanylate cyclase [Candidatus Cloacimonadota bacterium]
MNLNIAKYSKMYNDVLNVCSVEENLTRIIENVKIELPFQSLGVFIKIPNMDIFRYKFGENISKQFAKSTIFTVADPLIQELTNLKPVDMKFPGQYMFEHEYSHLLIAPILYRKKLKGFIFVDKEEGYFEKNDVHKLKAYSGIISFIIRVSRIEEELNQHKDNYEYFMVYNRPAFIQKSALVFSMMKRYNRYLSLAIFKIGNYKKVLRVIKELKTERFIENVSTSFQHDLRQSDLVGLLAKDEIAILLPETSAKNAVITLNRLRKKIQDVDHIKTCKIGWGIRTLCDADKNIDDIIENAEKAAFESYKNSKSEIVLS